MGGDETDRYERTPLVAVYIQQKQSRAYRLAVAAYLDERVSEELFHEGLEHGEQACGEGSRLEV